MQPQTLVGILLIVAGVLVLVYQGFSFTRQMQLAKVGSLEVDGENRQTIAISPVIGGICVAGGIVLLVPGVRQGH